jgi:membrane-associated HD superfamily phosphohydrolase
MPSPKPLTITKTHLLIVVAIAGAILIMIPHLGFLLTPIVVIVLLYLGIRSHDSKTLRVLALCLLAVTALGWWQANNVAHCNLISIGEKGVSLKAISDCQALGLYIPGRSYKFLGWPTGARNIIILPTLVASWALAIFSLAQSRRKNQ